MVGFCWGDTAVGWLRAEFDASKLAVGERDWPMSPVASARRRGPIAL